MLANRFRPHGVIVALLVLLPLDLVAAAPPVLTGRWGDTRLPQQLISDYSAKKTRALVVITFFDHLPARQATGAYAQRIAGQALCRRHPTDRPVS